VKAEKSKITKFESSGGDKDRLNKFDIIIVQKYHFEPKQFVISFVT